MPDIRQSSQYAKYIESIGWQVEKIGEGYAFIKKFPLLGSLIKVQRIKPPIPFEKIEKLAKKYHAFQIILEPALSKQHKNSQSPQPSQDPRTPHHYKPLTSPFIPTKTLLLDLKQSEKAIFASFSKSKRRDIRIAERHNLKIEEGTPEQFYKLKKKFLLRKRILPFGTKREIFPLCQAFGNNAKILIAYLSCPSCSPDPSCPPKPLAGLLLLFHQRTAYYWQAATTPTGNKLLAPTLLLWEAIKIAKKQGYQTFDFEGIYDERFPQNRSWLGFTHFKQGFGGKEVEFPPPLSSSKFPLNII